MAVFRRVRWAVAATAGLAALMLAPAPARAGTAFWHQYNDSAGGVWLAGDPEAFGTPLTTLSAVGFQFTDLSGDGPVAQSRVSVEIDSQWCDTAKDQFVEDAWFGYAPAGVIIDTARMLTASWPAVDLPLTGTEYRTPLVDRDCAALDWEHGLPAADLPAATLTMGASFTATSDVVVNTGRHARLDWWEGTLFLTLDAARGRWADGTASFSADEAFLRAALGRLGPTSAFGSIGRDIHIEADVVPRSGS